MSPFELTLFLFSFKSCILGCLNIPHIYILPKLGFQRCIFAAGSMGLTPLASNEDKFQQITCNGS